MVYRYYDEKTGNPTYDNRARNANRSLRRACRGAFTVHTPRGRRRKKQIMNVEMPRYMALVATVARELRREAGQR